ENKDINDLKDTSEANRVLNRVKVISLKERLKQEKFNSFEEEKEWLFKNSYRIIKTAGSSSLLKLVKTLKDDIPDQDIAAMLSKSNVIFFYITNFNIDAKQPRLQVIFADSNLYKNPGDFWQDIKTTGGIATEG